MQKLCFVTCQEQPDIYEDDRAFADLIALKIGADNLEAHPWDSDQVDWSAYDALILRTCWGYHETHTEFLAWLDHLADLDVKVINNAGLVRWNSDKSYLQDIRDWGMPTLQTRFTTPDKFAPEMLDLAYTHYATDQIIVKPCLSAASENTFRLHKSDDMTAAITLCQSRDMMIQAYSPELVETGEISLIYFGGVFSHAVKKVPKQGDFRSQPNFGGTVTKFTPTPEILATADALIAKTRPTYARIDGVVIDGTFNIIEYEVIEPDLFMAYAESDSAERAANAFLGAL